MRDNSDIGEYLESISELPIASKEDQSRLCDTIKNSTDNNDIEKAVNELVVSNVKLVFSRAKKFHDRSIGDISLMEYISDGNLALLKAAKCYDAKKSEAAFSTYAVACIDKSFFKTMRSHDIIRVPSNQTEKLSKIRKLQTVKNQKIEDDVLKKELHISNLGIEILEMVKNVKTVSSLDKAIVYDDQNESTLLDTIPDEMATPPHQKMDLEMLNEYLSSKIKNLSAKEQELLRLVFF